MGIPVGVSYCHVLAALIESTEPLMQRDLAQILNLNKSSITRLCRRLEDDGHLVISAHAVDGRARTLELTESGRDLAERIQVASRMRFAALLTLLPPAEHGPVLHSLALLGAALETLNRE